MLRGFRNPQYREWHKKVLEKSDNRCSGCECVATHAHHIKGWWESPELRFVVANGRALCKPCHEETHGFEFRRKRTRNRHNGVYLCGPIDSGQIDIRTAMESMYI